MKKFLLFCLICGAALILCFSLCGKTDNKTHIEFATWGSESEIKILKPMLEEFERENPEKALNLARRAAEIFEKYPPQNLGEKIKIGRAHV